ncbi:MAG: hypothetical protein ABJA20_03430 [Novosphingobium sp.]
MATTPRIPAELAAGFLMLGGGEEAPAARIAIPGELSRLAGIPIASEGSIQLDPVVHECIRLFNARYQGCEYCQNARQAVAVQAGLDEDMVSQLTRFESSSLPDHVKAALRIVDRIASGPQMLTEEVLNRARQFFSEQEICDIIILACFTTSSKVAITLGVDPGKEASSRLFYPTDEAYPESPQLKAAIADLERRGVLVDELGPGYDPIGSLPSRASAGAA